ncbi:hypothetical protein ARMSODRAFT_759977 [Armillaria solidipes]|uniref:Uncharacterized protein n=1 Tax=Armillaria solidipes TaxID=1076256 RepID=A0A2H3BNJ4_9AGAR|nr:hypothetical protein ARMSODRAFT_759977 [Armillaria solidipes]
MDRQTSRPVDPSDFLAQFIKDKEKLVVHPGTSRYTIGGVSACCLASLNFARSVLNREREGIQGAADIASVQTVEVGWRTSSSLLPMAGGNTCIYFQIGSI